MMYVIGMRRRELPSLIDDVDSFSSTEKPKRGLVHYPVYAKDSKRGSWMELRLRFYNDPESWYL